MIRAQNRSDGDRAAAKIGVGHDADEIVLPPEPAGR